MRRATILAIYMFLERKWGWNPASWDVHEAEQVTIRFSERGHVIRKRIMTAMLTNLQEEIRVIFGQSFTFTITHQHAVLSF